jgi:3',5'-cyclic AMP phosphodiesterase CpdA
MRLAHFSDIHVTHFPLSGGFSIKRAAAVASYTLGGRGRHFRGSSARVAQLLKDVDAANIDHAICTGDVTSVSSQGEFEEAAALFGDRLHQPERFTCLAGNHDRYIPSAAGLFEKHFGTLCPGSEFPVVKTIQGGVKLVLADVSRPTSVIDSSGLAGPAQRKRIEAILTDASMKDHFTILALHYGLLRMNGNRDRESHGLRDDRELLRLIDRSDVTLDAVIHGHIHRAYLTQSHRRVLFCSGSATDSNTHFGFSIYTIDPVHFRIGVERHEWNPETQCYELNKTSPMQQHFSTRLISQQGQLSAFPR